VVIMSAAPRPGRQAGSGHGSKDCRMSGTAGKRLPWGGCCRTDGLCKGSAALQSLRGAILYSVGERLALSVRRLSDCQDKGCTVNRFCRWADNVRVVK